MIFTRQDNDQTTARLRPRLTHSVILRLAKRGEGSHDQGKEFA